jgi:GT2 family glycosyltransferase
MTDDIMLSLSIVSHGQGAIIANLLDDLSQPAWHSGMTFEVIVTLNIPEDERWLERPFPYSVVVVRNEKAKGFGANHNAAFRHARGSMFAVVNPDIRLAGFRIEALTSALKGQNAGVCGPLVVAPGGAIEDSARLFPTIARILARQRSRGHGPDYQPAPTPCSVDWLAGMFLLFPSAMYGEIGGFDERYFMYLEDVEICRHLRQRGRDILWVTSTAVVHDASRASRRSMRHLRWHVRSLVRYLTTARR